MSNKPKSSKLTDFEKKILSSVLDRLKKDIVYQRWQVVGKSKRKREQAKQNSEQLRKIFAGIDSIKNKLRL